MQKIKMSLTGVEANPYRAMTRFQYQARKQGWHQREIDKVLLDATSDGHNHFVNTLLRNIT